MWIPVGGAPSYTLVFDGFDASASVVTIGNSAFFYYAGQTYFNAGLTIGKVAFKLNSVGDLTGKTLTARIWTQSGDDFNVNVASSNGVSGASWSSTEVEFIFSTPYTTSMGTNYVISLDVGGVDASNYAEMTYATLGAGPSPPPGYATYSVWGPSTGNDGKFGIQATGSEMQIKIYSTP